MPRLLRKDILFGGCFAHVISRSIRKMKLFKDDEDFQTVGELFICTKKKFHYKIHHYCLMQTHFHLVVSMDDVDEFSRAMQFVKSQYSYKFHTKYHLSGPIWRERYRSLLIEDEHYLRVCGQYVEDNPVRAGLVNRAKDWKYSSFRFYSSDINDKIIDRCAVGGSGDGYIKEKFEDEEFFENGKVIGSPFFRFQFYEKIKRS